MPKTKEVALKPVDRLKSILATDSVKEQFQNAMAENSSLFIASLIDIYGGDKSLQKCEPGAVVMEALKAAVLKLPLNKSLGFAWLIAYKIKGKYTPNFQIGYRGYVQMALRSGNYRYINADILYKGHKVSKDLLTGNCIITGEAENDNKAIGYFAYIELLNGFRKSIFWTRKEVENHARRFSKSYGTSFSPWKTDFDAMAVKTLITTILKKYGILSIEMASALGAPDINERTPEGSLEKNVQENANKEVIDIEPKQEPEKAPDTDPENDIPPNFEMTDEEKAAIEAEEAGQDELEF